MGSTHRYAVLVLAMLIALPALPQEVKKKDDDPNITCMPGWNGYYRPQRWMPLQFQVSILNPTEEAYEGALEITTQQDSLVKMTVRKDLLVTRDLPLETCVVAKSVYNPTEIRAVLTHKNAATWEENIAQMRTLRPLRDQDKLLVLVKDTRPSSVPQLASHYHSTGATDPEGVVSGNRGIIAVGSQAVEKLPDDWAAYDAVDVLVLQDPQWSQMRFLKQQAIAQWVRRGGRLLIVAGVNALPADNQIASLLPFKIGQSKVQSISNAQLQDWQLENPDPSLMTTSWKANHGDLPHYDLSQAPQDWRRAYFVDETGAATTTPWAVIGNVGFGQVGVIAFNPDTLFKDEVGPARPIWARLCRGMGVDLQDGKLENQDDDWRFRRGEMSPTGMPTSEVIGHLLAIPELRPLSIWWVIGLLSALALLLGPIDYLVLKKLDRLPWTWVTSSVIIVLFSVGAWYGVQKIRGGTLQVRVVSVIDAVQGQEDRASACYYGGIFAPDSDNYQLADPTRKDRAKSETQWWSAISPANDGEEASLASRQMYCTQTDDGNLITGLPINIWSMQCLLNETQDVKIPLMVRVQKVVDSNGQDSGSLRVIVTNLSDKEIVSGELRLSNERGFKLGKVPPNATEVFEQELVSLPQWFASGGTNDSFKPETAFFAEGTLQRTEGIKRMLERGSAVVSVRFNDAAIPFEIADRNNDIAHIQVLRLVAKIEPPVGQ